MIVRSIHCGLSANATLSYYLYLTEWDEKEKRIRWENVTNARREYLLEADRVMKEAITLHEQIERQLKEQGEYSAADITSRYRVRVKGARLRPFVDELCEKMKAADRISSCRSYQSALGRLEEFAGHQNLTLKDINPALLLRFEKTLLDDQLKPNTISAYMRALRAILNKAVKEGLVEKPINNPFADVFTGVEQTAKRALSAEMINLIAAWEAEDITAHGEHGRRGGTRKEILEDDELNHKVCEEHKVLGEDENNLIREDLCPSVSSVCRNSTVKLHQAQKIFLFCFFAQGMSFVDMAFLRKENIEGGVIRYRRRKTGQRIEVVLTAQLLRIIAYFAEETEDSPYLFPIIRRPGENERLQYESALRLQNKRLKRLAEQLTVDSGKPVVKEKETTNNYQLSTHVARHTWATQAKRLNIPVGLISECLGHTSEKTTRIYLGAFDQKALAAANQKVTGIIR